MARHPSNISLFSLIATASLLTTALLLQTPEVAGDDWEGNPSAPSESECRPYIEKALKEFGSSDGQEETETLREADTLTTQDPGEQIQNDVESERELMEESPDDSREGEVQTEASEQIEHTDGGDKSAEEEIRTSEDEGQRTEHVGTEEESIEEEGTDGEDEVKTPQGNEEETPSEETREESEEVPTESAEIHDEQTNSEESTQDKLTEEEVAGDPDEEITNLDADNENAGEEGGEERGADHEYEPSSDENAEPQETETSVEDSEVNEIEAPTEESQQEQESAEEGTTLEKESTSLEEEEEGKSPEEEEKESREEIGDVVKEEGSEEASEEASGEESVPQSEDLGTDEPTSEGSIEEETDSEERQHENEPISEQSEEQQEEESQETELPIQTDDEVTTTEEETKPGDEESHEDTKDQEGEEQEKKEMQSEEEEKSQDVEEVEEGKAQGGEESEEEKATDVEESEEVKSEDIEESVEEKSADVAESEEVKSEDVEQPEEGKTAGVEESEEVKSADVAESEEVKSEDTEQPEEEKATGVEESEEVKSEEVEQPEEGKTEDVKESEEEKAADVAESEEVKSEDTEQPEEGKAKVAEEPEEVPILQEQVETSETEMEKTAEEGPTPEEDLTMGTEIPEKLRSRDHIAEILKLDDESVQIDNLLRKTVEVTLRELKRIYEAAIKPLEILYKYRDLSNRHFGDSEIFSKPLILFMGPWSGGKSTIINYLLNNEYKKTALRTGAEPSPAYFNIVMWGEREEILDGTQLAADWTFSGLQKFGQGLLDRLKGHKLNNPLLEKVNIVEIPGILEIRKQVERLFPFNDACQWFIDRADIIFLVYDPSKLDVGPETEAILDQLKGREYQTRIILNKADQVKPEELMRVQGTLIWNISPLMSSTEPPVMYSSSLWSIPYQSGAPTRLLYAQEKAFLRDLKEAVDKRVENKIASARRFAVRVRNHAKMVDCYLTTYYNHKTFFGNKKKISDDIIEHPQNYHIYEGLSTLTNISRYDLPDPDVYKDFFRLNPVYDFQQLSATCTYFRGCPINRLDVAIAYDLPELVGKYKKAAEEILDTSKNRESS